MFRVHDALGISHAIAGMSAVDAMKRAKHRGVNTAVGACWHEMYGQYAHEEPESTERTVIFSKIEEMIWDDLANHL